MHHLTTKSYITAFHVNRIMMSSQYTHGRVMAIVQFPIKSYHVPW